MGKLTKFETLIWKIRREEEVEVFPTNPCQSQFWACSNSLFYVFN